MPYWKSDISYWGTLESTKVYTGWPTFQYPGISKHNSLIEVLWTKLTTESLEYQFEAFAQVPGVEFPDDSGAGQAGVYWFPTLSKLFYFLSCHKTTIVSTHLAPIDPLNMTESSTANINP